jgi:hypothetical protein
LLIFQAPVHEMLDLKEIINCVFHHQEDIHDMVVS